MTQTMTDSHLGLKGKMKAAFKYAAATILCGPPVVAYVAETAKVFVEMAGQISRGDPMTIGIVAGVTLVGSVLAYKNGV